MALGGVRRVLLLGSGFTATPLVDYLTRDGSVAVTVASNIEKQAKQLAAPFKNTSAVTVDVTCEQSLSSLIPQHQLVISYVPFQFHPLIAKLCIAHKVNMLTASYVSPALQELDESAKAAGITLFNEIGLDPGIDHMLALRCIDEVHSKGGQVLSFKLFCGGLPAPECADNPLKYKFSWSPRNALIGTMHPGKYLMEGKVVEIPQGGAIMETAKEMDFYPDIPLKMEGYPNRDSLIYQDVYNIPEAHTIVRGTLRYKGFCGLTLGLQRLGLLSVLEHPRLHPNSQPLHWRGLMAALLSKPDSDVHSAVSEALGNNEELVVAVEELGLLSETAAELSGTPLDTLCTHLEKRLQYKEGERDAVFMRLTFIIEWPDKSKEERHVDLTQYGVPHSYTAMAQCVAMPTAGAAQLILDGKVGKGIVRPTSPSVYLPILDILRENGLQAKEWSSTV